MDSNLANFTDILGDEIPDSQPLSLQSSSNNNSEVQVYEAVNTERNSRPSRHTGQYGEFRSVDEIDGKYKEVFSYPYFNLVQSRVIDDALYTDKSMVVCAPTGSGKTVVFEMAIVQLLMNFEDKKFDGDFKIIYMAPVKALCTERLTEWYPKFTKLGLLCIEVTGDTDVDFNQLKPYRIIITTPEKWDMMTRRWRDHRGMVEMIKLFLIDEVHILNDELRGPVLEAVVSRMKTIESSTQSTYRIEKLQRQYQNGQESDPMDEPPPRIRFIAVSATVSNPEDVATWLGSSDKPAVYYKFGDECRPVALKRIVEGYPCPDGTSIFKFDIILNYKLWPIIQKYHNGKPTLIFCNTRKGVSLTAEALSREITINFNTEQSTKLMALASTIKNKKLQSLILAGVGCHHAGLLYEERINIEKAFRNRDLPILITTTTLAMGVNLPAHLVIIKNTQQYVNGAYQEYSMSTVLQMVGRAGRPQYDSEATAVIMTRLTDKSRYQALVCGSEPLQSYLHKRLPENLNSEAALGTVNDVAQCVQWLRSTFLYVRAARDPRRYLGLPNNALNHLISKKIEELCVRAMNGLATAGLITMDEASCIESTEAGRLMSVFYLDLETMKQIMKIEGTETLERILFIICESHELSDMHLRVDERRCLNALNRNAAAATIRFPMKGKITTKQMKVNCIIQAILGCLPITDPSLNQEAMKIMRIADRVCKCLVAYVTRPALISRQPEYFSAILNSIILAKCVTAYLWENSPYVSKQLKGIGPTFSTLLATAGKYNFMLLEESHPRDLERIMNKGAPAGNILRKQITLLPKYQITMTPVDEKVVTVQLLLLNHNLLSENMEHLTAGEIHKSYIVAGDSENHVLLLTSFKDKDLIRVYDGSLTYDITRKHNFEHKVIVYCISSSHVGIDAQCEHLFQSLEPVPMCINTPNENTQLSSKRIVKQTCITDVFKERKRRNNDVNIAQSKEKKKRENAFTEKIRILKESFGKASKDLKMELNKSEELAKSLSLNTTQSYNKEINSKTDNINRTEEDPIFCNDNNKNVKLFNTNVNMDLYLTNLDQETNFEVDEFMDNVKIDDILSEIENEISRDRHNQESKKPVLETEHAVNTREDWKHKSNGTSMKDTFRKTQSKFPKTKTSNYDFIDLLEKNMSLSDEEPNASQNNTFSASVKQQVNKYLQKTETISKSSDTSLNQLIEINPMRTDDINSIPVEKVNHIKILTPETHNIDCNLIEDIQNVQKVPLEEESDPIRIEYNEISTCEKCVAELADNKNKTRLTNISITDFTSETDASNNYPKSIEKIPNQNECSSLIPIRNINSDFRLSPNNSFNDTTTEEITHKEKENCFKFLMTRPKTSVVDAIPKIDPISDCPNEHQNNQNSETINKQNVKNENYNNVTEDCRKRYSFSTSRVDISTHNTKDHKIQIIKRLKVDLDVTEIVSRNKATNYNKHVHRTVSPSNEVTKEVHEINELPRMDFPFNENNICTPQINTITNENSNKHLKAQYTMNPIVNKVSEVNQFSKPAKHAENIQKLPTNTYKNMNGNTDSFVSNGNKLENILQKYGEVFKNKIKSDDQIVTDTQKSHIDNTVYTPKCEKKSRPFKISDIHKVNYKLPTLVSETQLQTFTNYIENQDTISQRTKQKTDDNNMNISKTINQSTVVTQRGDRESSMQKSSNHVDINETEDVHKPESPMPAIAMSDLSVNDFNLDQAMFDPKTILQHFGRDTEIIAPPPQFSDANFISQSVDNGNEIFMYPVECDAVLLESLVGHSDEFLEVNTSPSRINETNTLPNLTSPGIIETWKTRELHKDTQQREESMNKTWTITHHTSRQIKPSISKESINSKRNDINKFKFINRNKLRM